jgi:uncharacterized membrane protein HdeD (DUF308 family)
MRQVSNLSTGGIVKKSPLRFIKPILYIALGVIFFMTPIYAISRTFNYYGTVATVASVQELFQYFEYVFATTWHNLALGGLFITLGVAEFYDGVIRKC